MASNQINFRGEVNEMSASYFIREMESLAPRSAATIYLHTPGGDIYAGGEMINALRAAMKRGCKFTLELGSLCASMGASLLAAARAGGCRVTAHANSEVMFHGCWSVLMGGADELTDQAKAMRDFNDTVKRDLAKCGLSDTDEWFAADRQKWLNAQELLDLGLVDEIAEEVAADTDLKTDAVKLAAKLNHKETPTMAEPEKKVEAPAAAAPETPAPEAPAAQPDKAALEVAAAPEAPAAKSDAAPVAADDDLDSRATALANERFAKLQAKHDKMISDLTKERDALAADLATAKAMTTSLQADIEKLEHDLADTRDQLAKSEQNRESVVVAALTPSAEPPTLQDGLAACKTLAERVAFLKSGNYKH